MPLSSLIKDKKFFAIIGYQWGDEGKGKWIDAFTEYCDIVARGTGGNNAGHTVKVNGKEYIFHLLPSGIIHEDKTFCIGCGVVVDPRVLVKELEELEKANISWNNLYISGDAVVITPDLIFLDRANEILLGDKRIGTTGRGIGPAYESLVKRNAIRINDIRNKDMFRKKLKDNIETIYDLFIKPNKGILEELKKIMMKKDLVGYYDEKNFFNIEAIIEDYIKKSDKFKDNIRDVSSIIFDFYKKGKRILLEGSQGMLLSVLHGTTKYTTSCSVGVGWLSEGVGFPAQLVDQVYGAIRCPIMNRVGNGPFPTQFGGRDADEYYRKNSYKHKKELEIKNYPYPIELINSNDDFKKGIGYRIISNNYGSTTQRPRRTGWIDLVALKHVAKISGEDVLVTHLDDCNFANEIKLGIGYMYEGGRVEYNGRILNKGDRIGWFPINSEILYDCKPIYEALPGWKQDLSGITNYNELPANAKKLLERVEEIANVRIKAISISGERSSMIIKE